MQHIDQETMPYWNTASLIFMWVVIGIVVVTFLVLLIIDARAGEMEWSADLQGLTLLTVAGGMFFFLFASGAWAIQSIEWESNKYASSLEELGYTSATVGNEDEPRFTASLDGDFVEGILVEHNGRMRVVHLTGPGVE